MNKYIGITHKRDNNEEHFSSLAVTKDGRMEVIGVIPHNTQFLPRDKESAQLMIDWLEDWMEQQRKFTYHINLDERGEFNADVRDCNDTTVFEFSGGWMFEDGFMDNKKDVDGLASYLASIGLIPLDALLSFEA